MDVFDYEAEMMEEAGNAWAARVEAARGRVAEFNALPPGTQAQRLLAPCDKSCLRPEMIRIATRII